MCEDEGPISAGSEGSIASPVPNDLYFPWKCSIQLIIPAHSGFELTALHMNLLSGYCHIYHNLINTYIKLSDSTRLMCRTGDRLYSYNDDNENATSVIIEFKFSDSPFFLAYKGETQCSSSIVISHHGIGTTSRLIHAEMKAEETS